MNEENTKKNKQFKSTIEGFSLTSSLGDLLRRKSLSEVESSSGLQSHGCRSLRATSAVVGSLFSHHVCYHLHDLLSLFLTYLRKKRKRKEKN